jgi:hypothetical protein
MGTLSRLAFTDAEKLKKLRLIRVDLGRSLRMQRGLALGIGACGLVLAALYLFLFWPHASGSPHPDELGVTVNAGVLVLFSFVVAMAAAMAALRMDPRVYVGNDIEQVLGVGAMGELPDFAEVPADVSGQRMQRLANAVALACQEGSLKRCLFTGTGRGAGVTTIAVRVRESLEGAGRAATLVGASAVTGDTPGEVGLTATQEAADESGSRQDSLILTDAAPLTESADTEYLARFADCVMVVVESGVTTRTQLLNTVSCLQRLNVGAVGFVVNRVKPANADAQFRRSVEKHSAEPGSDLQNPAWLFETAMQRALAEQPPKESSAAPALKPASLLAKRKRVAKPATAKPTTALAVVRPASQSSVWASAKLPSWLNEALAQLETPQPSEKTGAVESGREGGKEASDKDLEDVTLEETVSGNESKPNDIGAMLFSMGLKDPFGESDSAPQAGEKARPFFRGNQENNPSRLSGLRGIASAESLRELGQGRQPERRSSEPFRVTPDAAPRAEAGAETGGVRGPFEAAPPAMAEQGQRTEGLSGLRGMFSSTGVKDLSGLTAAMPEPGSQAASARASEATQEKPSTPLQELAGTQNVSAVPEAESAKPTAEVASRAAKPDEIPQKPPATEGLESHANYNEVQILPSKRGQYRRKK